MQTVYLVSFEHYSAQMAEYNQVIQATVAAAMDGLTPDRVTNITVTARSSATTDQCLLQYTVKVHDQALTYEVLHAQLLESVLLGKMDSDLHIYAAQFGVRNLNTGSFIAPVVLVHGAPTDHTTHMLTAGSIFGIVVGSLIFAVMMCAVMVMCGRGRRSQSRVEESQEGFDYESIYGPNLV